MADRGERSVAVRAAGSLESDVTAAFSEVSRSGSDGVRVKLYDKKAALDTIARHLSLFAQGPQREERAASSRQAEDARERLALRLARLASGGTQK